MTALPPNKNDLEQPTQVWMIAVALVVLMIFIIFLKNAKM